MAEDYNLEENNRHEGVSLVFDLNNAILYRWNGAIGEVRKRYYYSINGASGVWDKQVCASVFELYCSVRVPFCKDLSEKSNQDKTKRVPYINYINEYEKVFTEQRIERVLALFQEIDLWLYDKGVTKFDTKKVYDRKRVEVSNKHKGL